MALGCEKGLFCKKPVVEQCSYCGKHFCLQHGFPDKAACKSYSCQRKYKKDKKISDRANYENEVQSLGIEKNTAGYCGYKNCFNEVYVACGHCEVQFCPVHVTRYSFSFKTHTRRGVTRVKGDITLCETCKPYLREYQRDRYE